MSINRTKIPPQRLRGNSMPAPSANQAEINRRKTKKSKSVTDEGSTKATLTAQMQKLNPAQIRAFQEIFENFDLEKSGTLTAEELHKCINQLAGYQALSFDDVMQILGELDVKGTGDIEFDEFIYFMTRPRNLEKMLTADDRKHILEQTGVAIGEIAKFDDGKAAAPGDVLFDILQRVLEQENNTEIRNFYRQQILSKMDDNVIHDWSDGKRCIGLTNQTIMRRYKEIAAHYRRDQSFKKYLDSPYAKPNKWGLVELKRDIEASKSRRVSQSTKKENKRPERVKVNEMEITVEAVALPTYWVRNRPSKFTYDDLKTIRENVTKLKKKYYRYLKEIAASNAGKFHSQLEIDNIGNENMRQQANYAFESYCNPFVVSPWVPSPNPTSWKISVNAPVGKAVCRSPGLTYTRNH